MSDKALNSRIVTEIVVRPYSPSWINRVTNWIDSLPGPALAPYFIFGFILYLLQMSSVRIEGKTLDLSFSIIPIYVSVAIPSLLGLTRFFDLRAEKALENMHSVLNLSDEKYYEIQYRLTTLPSGKSLLASLILVCSIFGLEAIYGTYQLAELEAMPVSSNVVRLIYYIGFWVLGAFFYHTLHQLHLINEIYSKHTQVNLFRIKPLYAFSNLSALTAGSIAMITYGWLLVNPDLEMNAGIVLLNVIIFLLVLVTFLWPQLGIHGLQVKEKDRLVEEANQRLEKIINEIHESVDGGKLGRMAELNLAIMTIEIELKNLKSIHTWPWQPETVRWLVTALVLPLGLWLLQFVLQRVLGQ